GFRSRPPVSCPAPLLPAVADTPGVYVDLHVVKVDVGVKRGRAVALEHDHDLIAFGHDLLFQGGPFATMIAKDIFAALTQFGDDGHRRIVQAVCLLTVVVDQVIDAHAHHVPWV